MTTATPTKPTALGGPFTLGPVRVAWPHLLTPKTRTNDQGKTTSKFEAVILIDKKDVALVDTVRANIKASFAAKFGSEAKLVKDKQPLRDGDESVTADGDDAGKYPGYFYFNVGAWADNPPILKHADKTPITSPGAMSSGDFIFASLKPRAYAFENTKGVAIDILGARLVKKGDPIGGGAVDKSAVANALDEIEIEVAADDEAF